MKLNLDPRYIRFLAPERGGDSISGGGHPADDSPPEKAEINPAMGEPLGGRGMTPGIGAPGTKTNPVGEYAEAIARRAYEIWEEEGRPEGRTEEHWLRAEFELGQRDELK